MPIPKKVTLTPSQVLIEWSDGHKGVHTNKALREECPCAMCQGEPPAIGRSTVIRLIPSAPEGVGAVKYSMVGRYAIAFVWSDGHSTGIYPYEYLLDLCECESCVAAKSVPRVE
ncbi:MAG: gamma-butyrobetaine hydroxylase-like domain-containing protein [Nitrososphaerales archaeon]